MYSIYQCQVRWTNIRKEIGELFDKIIYLFLAFSILILAPHRESVNCEQVGYKKWPAQVSIRCSDFRDLHILLWLDLNSRLSITQVISMLLKSMSWSLFIICLFTKLQIRHGAKGAEPWPYLACASIAFNNYNPHWLASYNVVHNVIQSSD